MFVSYVLTLQAFTDEHTKPGPPVQGSLKDIFIGTFKAFVKLVEAVISAVGGTVSAKLRYNMNQLIYRQSISQQCGGVFKSSE